MPRPVNARASSLGYAAPAPLSPCSPMPIPHVQRTSELGGSARLAPMHPPGVARA